MPTFQVTTKDAKKIWSAPDGQRSIHEVLLDINGEVAPAKTYSDKIAVVGWTGEVETYEKPGRNGGSPETFVKQVPKENNYAGGGRGNYQPKDEAAIRAMWAIGQAIQWLNGSPKEDADSFSLIGPLASDLFAMVERVKNANSEEPTKAEEKVEDVDATQLKEAFNKVFGDDENFTVEGEKEPLPWKNPLKP